MRKVFLHGKLAKLWGEEHQFDIRTPGEACRALIATCPGFDHELQQGHWQLVRTKGGQGPLTLDLRCLELPLARGHELHIMPAAKAAGTEAIIGYILVTLLTAAVVYALMPPVPPMSQNDKEDQRQSWIFSGGQNVQEQGWPYPLVYGEIITGSIVGSAGIENASIPLGSADDYTDFRTKGLFGDATDPDWYRTVLAGGGGGGQNRPAQEDPNTLQSQATARIIDIISEGEIEGLVDGLKSVYFDDVPVINADDTENFKGVAIVERVGTPNQSFIPGFTKTESPTALSPTKVTVAAPVVGTISNTNANRARVTIKIPALFSRNLTNGDVKGTTLQMKLEVQANGGGYTEILDHTFRGKCTTPYLHDFDVILPAGGAPWTIRVKRVTADSGASELANDLWFETLTEVVDVKLSYADIAHFGIVADARQFGTRIPKRTYKVRGIRSQVPMNYDPVARTYATTGPGTTGGAWDGTFKTAWHRDPAWVYYDLTQRVSFGLGRQLAGKVDKWALYTISQRCCQMISDGKGGTEPRHSTDLVINSREQAIKVLRSLASSFQSIAYWGNSTLQLVQDAPVDPAMLVVPANTKDGRIVYSGAKTDEEFSVAIVSFNDPEDFHRLGYELVEDAVLVERLGWKPKEMAAFGKTSRSEAHREGRWFLERQKIRMSATYVAGPDHSRISPGKVIKISDPVHTTSRWGGRAVSATTTSLTIDDPITIAGGTTYTLSVILPDGTVATKTLTNAAASNVTVLTWSGALSAAPQNASIWSLESNVTSSLQFRVVSTKPEEASFQVRALRYDPTIYDRVEQNLNISPASFTALPTGALEPPTAIGFQEFLRPTGNSTVPAAQISWPAAIDARVNGYEVQVKLPGVQNWQPLSGDAFLSRELYPVEAGTYGIRIRSLDSLGRNGPWIVDETVTAVGPSATMPEVVSPTIAIDHVALITTLRWTKPADTRPLQYEILRNTVNTLGSATIIGLTSDFEFPVSSVGYYWVRTAFMTQRSSSPTSMNVTSAELPEAQWDRVSSVPTNIAGLTGTELINNALVPVSGYNRNPTFQAWASTLPDTWSSSGSPTVAKNTTNEIYGNHCLDVTTGATSNVWLLSSNAAEMRVPELTTYVTLEYEIELVSGDFKRSGISYRSFMPNGSNYRDWRISFETEHGASPVAGRYGGARTFAFGATAGSPTGNPVGSQLLLSMNWSGLVGSADSAKQIRWHRVLARPATKQEIAATLALQETGKLSSIAGVFGDDLKETVGGAVATLNNFKTPLGTAAGIAGQGDLATANRATLPFGSNGLVDTGFRWQSLYWTSTPLSGTAVWSAVQTTEGLRVGVLTGAGVTVNGTDYILGGSHLQRTSFPCKAGDTVGMRVLVGSSNASSLQLRIMFRNAAGTLINSLLTSLSSGLLAGTGDESTFNEMTLSGVASAGALTVNFEVRAIASTSAPILRLAKPMLTLMATGQTAIPLYSPGREHEIGANVTEGRTAAAIASQGALATLSSVLGARLGAGVSKNALIDPEFRFGATYWASLASAGSVVVTNAQSSNGIRRAILTGTGVTIGQYVQYSSSPQINSFPIVAGEWLEASAYLGGSNLSAVQLFVEWKNAADASISFSSVVADASPTAGNGDLSTFERLFQIVQAPANTVKARLIVRGVSSTTAPVLNVAKPLLAKAQAGQTEATPWNPGFDSEQGANVTETRTAAAITGQGNQATASITRGNTASRPATPADWSMHSNTETNKLQLYTTATGWIDIASLNELLNVTRSNSFVKLKIGSGTNTSDSCVFTGAGGSGTGYTYAHALYIDSTTGPTATISSASGTPITVSATGGVPGDAVTGFVLSTVTDSLGNTATLRSPVALTWEA